MVSVPVAGVWESQSKFRSSDDEDLLCESCFPDFVCQERCASGHHRTVWDPTPLPENMLTSNPGKEQCRNQWEKWSSFLFCEAEIWPVSASANRLVWSEVCLSFFHSSRFLPHLRNLRKIPRVFHRTLPLQLGGLKFRTCVFYSSAAVSSALL